MRHARARGSAALSSLVLAAAGTFVAPSAAAATGLPCGVTGVAAGGSHALVLGPGGTVHAMGNNSDGQLGDGTTSNRSTAVQVSGLTGVTAVSAGSRFSLAIGAGGTVYAWGDNAFGQLGDGTTTDRVTPVPVQGLTGITAISAGVEHALAIGAGGIVYGWGNNITGMIGDGTTVTRPTPVQATGLTGVTQISAAYRHSFAVRNGSLYGWGAQSGYRLGDGQQVGTRPTPAVVAGLSGVTMGSGGWQHSMALAGGTVQTWGTSPYGQTGDGTNDDRPYPGPASGLGAMTAIDAGYHHSVALAANGTVWAWGANDSGQSGDGTNVHRTTPGQVIGLNGITSIASGNEFDFAIGAGGTLYGWGNNTYGQLGDGTTTNKWTPVQLNCLPTAPTLSSVTDGPDPVAAGGTVTFNLSWSDPNAGDQVRALVCKTNAASNGSCTGGAWAVGAPTANTPATASYTTVTADIGTRSYWAFACDTTARCSSSIAGTFTVNGAAPTATAATDAPDPVVAGNPVTFTVAWTDPNAGDSVRAVICKSSSIAGGTCSAGAWATGSAGPSSPATVTKPTTANDIGTHSYWAFACDAANLCSSGIAGSFTVNGVVPQAQSASAQPSPVTAGHPVNFSVTWTDPNPGDRARAVICKTDAIAPASCPGGAWAIGGLSPTSPATASYTTTTADIGTRTYYAFVCDASNACSESVTGTFTVVAPACSDGVDNDGDGRADHPSDPGCSSATDETEGAECSPLVADVLACVTTGSVHQTVRIDTVSVSPAIESPDVAGYVETYKFTVNGVPATVNCVRLLYGAADLNPCKSAGGTYVSRFATLLAPTEVTGPAASTSQLTAVSVCTAELTLRALGTGVESAAIYALC